MTSSQHDSDTIPPDLLIGKPCVWINPHLGDASDALARTPIAPAEVDEARHSWNLFAPLLGALFPELRDCSGRIDSPLIKANAELRDRTVGNASGKLWIKADHLLPLTSTIKARGGVFEVLQYAHHLAHETGLMQPGDPITKLAGDEAKRVFADHTIMTGSTGNLGYSIGLVSRVLGFSAEVHMSRDAKSWKKQGLRDIGAKVVEHAGDFGTAVAEARRLAGGQPNVHFVDDENSKGLFLGYSAAAFDLERQLDDAGIRIGPDHPLVVYLPCGVGGSPGGVTFGLKRIFGDNVQCYLVEPVASPAMLVQLASGLDRQVTVYDCGLDNVSAADGLAVAAASLLAASNINELVDGIVTVEDSTLFVWLRYLWNEFGLRLEPSATAGFAAAAMLKRTPPQALPQGAVHVVWTTGGSRIPDGEFAAYLGSMA